MTKLKGKTLFITGATRGIGFAIAKKAAMDGANIVIAAKTTDPHPTLPGTIYTAADELKETGITVNVLLPGGATDTDLLPPSKNKKGADGNLLEPSIMIEPAVWLASEFSDSVTGGRVL